MPPQTNGGMDTQDILLIIGAVGTFLSAILIPGIIAVIKAVKENTTTLNAIHTLTNSNHTTSLQLVADSTLKTAQSTSQVEDFKIYESAEKALNLAQEATKKIEEDDAAKKSK